jgi:hypothetical protein
LRRGRESEHPTLAVPGDGISVLINCCNISPAGWRAIDDGPLDVRRQQRRRGQPPHIRVSSRSRGPQPGGGAHICIGAPLARLEAKRVFLRLAERFPRLQLAEAGPPRWRTRPFFRGIETLTVVGEPG